jgi:hypothetical protein
VVSVFITLYIVQTALSLPGATIFSLTAGAIFGALMGTVYAVTAATMSDSGISRNQIYIRDAVQNKLFQLTK